ncbi:hypothetical protein EMIT0P100_10260 [Pseudomonas sp. IT-P100]
MHPTRGVLQSLRSFSRVNASFFRHSMAADGYSRERYSFRSGPRHFSRAGPSYLHDCLPIFEV